MVYSQFILLARCVPNVAKRSSLYDTSGGKVGKIDTFILYCPQPATDEHCHVVFLFPVKT